MSNVDGKARILTLVQQGNTVSGAAELAGVPRRTVYAWKRADLEFATAMATAMATTTAPASDSTGPATYDEMLAILAARARAGNVRAAEVVMRELRPIVDEDQGSDEQRRYQRLRVIAFGERAA